MNFQGQYEVPNDSAFYTAYPIVTHKKTLDYVKKIPPLITAPPDKLVSMVWPTNPIKHTWKPRIYIKKEK